MNEPKGKSKKIGTIIKGYYICDSTYKQGSSYYYIKCVDCGYEGWKSGGFLRAKALCPNCQHGRNMRNAKGFEHERLYERYRCILRRVYSKEKYHGVTICKEWEDDYLSFRKWALKNGYRDELTIDRIDNSKGYSPDNCRWATPKQQANNRRSNIRVTYEGKEFTLSELADYIHLPMNTVKLRYEHGWNIVDIAKTPYKSRKKWSDLNNEQAS